MIKYHILKISTARATVRLLEYWSIHKALIIFQNDVPNSHDPAILESLVKALSPTSHSKSAKHTCKSHAACTENSLYLLLINT